ncbi:hypothetical protein PC118_g6932 [Phytophthora cactorum]|uniref:Uncharacterized protein n=1 Tax=Phytophthora cactorum TaxID=29920 RepID=A0A8T1G802_9STRA|nr:hypothetical protein PC114_g20327 [Phytophthora cactorum]KAG2988065.1 hypothetical protein PC118_g6932 [Phytophthora cactorum]KAG3017997.1 hypothetical protein PC119_g10830 [Phytophthora cactorum]
MRLHGLRLGPPRMARHGRVHDSAQRGGGRFSQNPSEWFIAKHDVYGAKFREKWSKNSKESSDEEDLFNFRF